jgi:hypothetical protein
MNNPEDLIPPHGGYRQLKSYQMSEIVYDATVAFCDRCINIRSRTHAQADAFRETTGFPDANADAFCFPS